MARYRSEDFVSTERLAAINTSANGVKNSELSLERNSKVGLSSELNQLTGLLINAAIREEENSEKAKAILADAITSWENEEGSEVVRRKFVYGMRLFAKNNAGKIWSRFFGNVYPKNTVVSWEKENDGDSLVPSLIMDGETPYGGFFNNPRVIELVKKDPDLGSYLLFRSLELLGDYATSNKIGMMNAHFEASMISTYNLIDKAGSNFSDEKLSLISKEILSIVNLYIDFRKKVMTGDGEDLMDEIEVPDELKLRVSILGFLKKVIYKVIDRNNNLPKDEVKIVDTGNVFAPEVLKRVQKEMPIKNHF